MVDGSNLSAEATGTWVRGLENQRQAFGWLSLPCTPLFSVVFAGICMLLVVLVFRFIGISYLPLCFRTVNQLVRVRSFLVRDQVWKFLWIHSTPLRQHHGVNRGKLPVVGDINYPDRSVFSSMLSVWPRRHLLFETYYVWVGASMDLDIIVNRWRSVSKEARES